MQAPVHMLQPDAKERFMDCKRAYQALSDSRERARYDRVSGCHVGSLHCGLIAYTQVNDVYIF